MLVVLHRRSRFCGGRDDAASVRRLHAIISYKMIEPARRGVPSAQLLVVEDDYDAQEIYRETLTRAKHAVEIAGTLREARSHTRFKRPDAVVLDLRLPDGSGLDLLQEWKTSQTSMATVPIVIVTAFGELSHVDAATQAGADAFIVKPCPPSALIAFLARVLMATAPTRRLPRFSMSQTFSSPPVVFTYGRGTGVATLHRIDPQRLQARCEPCFRSSPVVRGTLEDAIRELVALGWTTDVSGGFTCPICHERAAQRSSTRRRTLRESD